MPPAKAVVRRIQSRRLARRFSAHIVDGKDRQAFRLLQEPIYRYQGEDGEDGRDGLAGAMGKRGPRGKAGEVRDLDDVDLSGLAEGSILVRRGDKWVPEQMEEVDE